MGFACSFRPEFDQVVVAFAKRDQPGQLYQLAAFAEPFRIKANTLDQEVNPFLCCKLNARLDVTVKIKMR